MPQKGYCWRHIQINTYCFWLKGDSRGFRAKHHELHSSGDYKNPPPRNEHAGLRQYFAGLKDKEVRIECDCRAIIGRALLQELRNRKLRVLAIAVAKVHAHFVVEMPDDVKAIRTTVGELKRRSSRAAKKWMPGKVWSRGEHPVRVETRSHLSNATVYVLYDQGPDAWTWGFRDRGDEGMFARPIPPAHLNKKKRRKK